MQNRMNSCINNTLAQFSAPFLLTMRKCCSRSNRKGGLPKDGVECMQPRLQLNLAGAVTDPWPGLPTVMVSVSQRILPYPIVDFQLGLHGVQLPASRTSSPRTSERLDSKSPWPWRRQWRQYQQYCILSSSPITHSCHSCDKLKGEIFTWVHGFGSSSQSWWVGNRAEQFMPRQRGSESETGNTQGK